MDIPRFTPKSKVEQIKDFIRDRLYGLIQSRISALDGYDEFVKFLDTNQFSFPITEDYQPPIASCKIPSLEFKVDDHNQLQQQFCSMYGDVYRGTMTEKVFFERLLAYLNKCQYSFPLNRAGYDKFITLWQKSLNGEISVNEFYQQYMATFN